MSTRHSTGPVSAVDRRLAVTPRLRGARVRLPAEAEVADIASAGLDFVLIDLIHGPVDETILLAHVRLGHSAGLLVLASVDDPGRLHRLARLGVDAVSMPSARAVDAASGIAIVDSAQLTIVTDPAESSDTALTAVDLMAARQHTLQTMAWTSATREPTLPLVLLAGQLGDVSVWDDVVGHLPESGRYLALRIDLDNSIEGMAASVLAAAPARFALAGHSLGGIVALQIWRSAPERVDRLALLNASGRAASAEQQQSWVGLQSRLDAGEFDDIVGELADGNLDASDPDLGVHRARWVRMARVVGAAGLRRQLTAQYHRPDSLPGLGDLTVPTLIVSGESDRVCRPALQEELAQLLPHAEHVVLPGVGHMSPLTAPELVARQLTGWLAG